VPDPTDELRHRHAGQRVLLAEDNPVNREIALEMLTSAGLVVETASDGQRALQMAQTRSYDVILMDVQMPHMDGLSATRAIRERSGRVTPIIAITANAFAEDRAAAEAAGMNDYIVKPFRPEVLYGTLLRWLPLRDSANDGDGTATAAGFAPIEDQRPLKQRLASVAELDVATALDHCGGQEVTLRRALVCFASAYRAGEPALLQAHDDGADPVPVWLAKCHSMRGACASIGASPLVLRIQAFEARLRAGGPGVSLGEEARAVDRAMSDLSATLIAVLGRDPVGGPSGVTARPSHQPG
jgi:CheY-like chemotaxis protein